MKVKIEEVDNPLQLNINSIQIQNDNNFNIKFYNYGGYIHQINIPLNNQEDIIEDVLLGYGNIEKVIDSNGYFNSIIGRFANRINLSKFNLNNTEYNLYTNDNKNSLHGGKIGFNKKIWKLENIEEKENSIKCIMKYLSIDMEENYPGNLDCTVTYELNNYNELLINFHAISDKDTIVNLTNHNYWNFHGHRDDYQNIKDHIVQIESSSFCEIDKESIPTGKIVDVEGTKFDLRKDFLINNDFLSSGGIDHNYVLDDHANKNTVAKIFSKKTGLGVEYYTNQPGIQFYTGNMMLEKYIGKYGRSYGRHWGMCLEPQNYPDAINQSNFPSSVLRKNKNYLSKIKIKLRNDF